MVQQYFAWKEGERILWPPELDAKILTIPVSPQTITNFRLIIGPSRIDELKLSPEIPLPPQIASLEEEFLSWNLNALRFEALGLLVCIGYAIWRIAYLAPVDFMP